MYALDPDGNHTALNSVTSDAAGYNSHTNKTDNSTNKKIESIFYRGRVSHATNSHPHRGSKSLFSDELSQTWVRFARAHRVPHLGKPFVTGRWNTSPSVESVGVSPHKVPAGLCSSEPSSQLNKQLA